MKLTGDFTFDNNQQNVWAVLMDPQAIANALPGVDEMIPLEDEVDAWRAEAKIGVASIKGTYAGIVRMSEREAPTRYRLTVSGEGQQSIISGTALISLNWDEEQQATLLTWEADANISGKLARVGQRIFTAAANLLSKQFFSALAQQLTEDENT